MQWTVIVILSITLLYFAIPPLSPVFKGDYSTVIKSENGELLHVFVNQDQQWHFPPDTFPVPEKLKIAVITFEDESFYKHIGIDFRAVFRALWQNFKNKRIISGASTIPMQVARMRAQRERTYFNKIGESVYAIRLTVHNKKDEVLKLYLDHAPYGGNVIGYRTASMKYFGKEASELTWSEAATLAVLPNAPGLIYPTKTSSLLRSKRDLLLKKLFEKEIIEDQTYRLAMLEPIPDRFLTFESIAPHLARKLRNENPSLKIIVTTINDEIQKQCNQIASRYSNSYSLYGIYNLAILVVETRSGAVRAYTGSSDFFDHDHGGQVDGVFAPRSSGSILKPFLYALSIDEGLILPESFIRDLPTYFEGFSPKNASRDYKGVVTARDALVESLNIPAVRLLNSYGIFQFYSFLKEAGVNTLFRSSDEYGLPLILGGAEVNMWEMAMLFRGLANEGIFSENYLLNKNEATLKKQLISPGSSYLTLDILKDLKRPGSEYFWERFNSSRPFAWKTGTSFGHKDAWAIGVNTEYTIAVWVGNFSGQSNNNLSGAASAGPILFDILHLLPHENSQAWFEKKEINFREMKICKLSGFRAGDACPDCDTVLVPRGMKPLQVCDYHQFRFFSTDEKYQSCSRCWNIVGSKKKSVTIYPPDIAYYLREKGQYIEPLAIHFPECTAYKSEESLKIIYPNMEAKLFLPRDFNGKTQPVICRAAHNGKGVIVYWYLNDHYLGSTIDDNKMDIVFREGWNTLKIIDENGAEDSRRVFATFSKVDFPVYENAMWEGKESR